MKRYQEDKVVSEKWQQALNNELEELSKTMSSMWTEGWDNGDKDNNQQESNDRCLQGLQDKEKGHLMCLDIPSLLFPGTSQRTVGSLGLA